MSLRIINLTTSAESVKINGHDSMTLPAGSDFDLAHFGTNAEVRGVLHSVDGTNDMMLVLGPFSVRKYVTPGPEAYLHAGFDAGAVVGAMLLSLCVVWLGLKIGIEPGSS